MNIYGILARRIKMWIFKLRGGTRYGQTFCNPPLLASLGQTRPPSHISDHLNSLFFFALDASPRLMVELGTGGGESTRVLLTVAELTGADLLSVNVRDRGQLDLPFKERWHFVQADDVEFGRAAFPDWCRRLSLQPKIDLLFIDTSHYHEHTQREIETWVPYLSEHGIVILHDTNMGQGPYARLDGSVGFGYDNQRGVVRALEEWLGRQFDETSFFCDWVGGFLVMHHPHCNGLAIIKKHAPAARRPSPTGS